MELHILWGECIGFQTILHQICPMVPSTDDTKKMGPELINSIQGSYLGGRNAFVCVLMSASQQGGVRSWTSSLGPPAEDVGHLKWYAKQ